MAELEKSGATSSMDDEEFVNKASYFVMATQLVSSEELDYEKYIRNIDMRIPKSFIQSIIESICVTNGRVTSITFKNGITHTFNY